MILSKIDRLRDPCILVENGTYYAYGTGWGNYANETGNKTDDWEFLGWVCYRNTSGSLDGDWEFLGEIAKRPENAITNFWAPEVHKYNGAFYMFTTYKSSKNGHRGCTVLKADAPEGPFVEISNGHLTPADWDAIDATLYIDKQGQPWMVFVHEWTSTADGIGTMAAAKLSPDLSHFISEPIELFRADDAPWANYCVTDGCWLYRCRGGELIMIWSNFAPDGYSIGIARSDNGEIDGNWSQDTERLFSRELDGTYDGGHGMIFHSLDGKMYLSLHSPNAPVGDRKETPIFIPIKEQNATLVWDN